MSKVSNIGDVYHWSVFKIAEAFGMHRDTVKKRLVMANVPIAGTVKSNPVYALQHVGPALFTNTSVFHTESTHDPATMDPKSRKDWYQSENERLKLEKEQRKLIPVDEVVFVYSSLRKSVVQILETLPDILERDCGLSPRAISVVQDSIDNVRYSLAERGYEACAAEMLDEEGEPGEEV